MPDTTHPVTRIPVLRPQLPDADALLPYLRSLDESRIYTNLGPMVLRLEQRLCALFGQANGGVTAAASGTAALIGAILTKAGRAGDRPLALCPSYTFVATVTAAQGCGYQPHLVDIASDSCALDPNALRTHPRLADVGVVLVTAPFGRCVDLPAWERFEADTGVPVVIDCAAGFDTLLRHGSRLSATIPMAVSFHATKSFGCGEGGAVLCADPDFARRCHRALNNGLLGCRQVVGDNTNGKMSEYHACVGMAELDRWPDKQARYDRMVADYRMAAQQAGVKVQVGGAQSAVYALYTCPEAQRAEGLRMALAYDGFDSRFWYGAGLHAENGFGPFPQDLLPHTDDVAPRVLGLPAYLDLPRDEMQQICAIIARST